MARKATTPRKPAATKSAATGTSNAARAAALATALDIASDEGVNLETAASYLHGANPEHFATVDAAREALKAELAKRAK